MVRLDCFSDYFLGSGRGRDPGLAVAGQFEFHPGWEFWAKAPAGMKKSEDSGEQLHC